MWETLTSHLNPFHPTRPLCSTCMCASVRAPFLLCKCQGRVSSHPTPHFVQRVCASVCVPFLLCKCQTSHPIPPLVQRVYVTSHPSPCATCMCASICAPFMVLQMSTNYTTFVAHVEAYDPMGKINMMDLHECTYQGKVVLRAVFKNVVWYVWWKANSAQPCINILLTISTTKRVNTCLIPSPVSWRIQAKKWTRAQVFCSKWACTVSCSSVPFGTQKSEMHFVMIYFGMRCVVPGTGNPKALFCRSCPVTWTYSSNPQTIFGSWLTIISW